MTTGQTKEAYDATSECLTILAPYFDEYPRVFADLAVATIADYLKRSRELGVDFDRDLLERYGELDIQDDDDDDAPK